MVIAILWSVMCANGYSYSLISDVCQWFFLCFYYSALYSVVGLVLDIGSEEVVKTCSRYMLCTPINLGSRTTFSCYYSSVCRSHGNKWKQRKSFSNNLNLIDDYCNTLGIEITGDTTNIIVFRTRGWIRVNKTWTYNGIYVEVVDSFNHLGTGV